MTLSGRHGPALLGLLLLAMAPIVWLQRYQHQVETCRDPAALFDTSAIPGAQSRGQRLERVGDGVLQWSEGRVPLGRNQHLEFQVVRSFDAGKLYENPTRLMRHEIEPEEHEVVMRTVEGVVLPIHLVRDGAQTPPRIGAYLFVYGNEPVRYPFLFALRTSIGQAIGGTRPLTAILIEAPVARRRTPETEERAVQWLVDAWHTYALACR